MIQRLSIVRSLRTQSSLLTDQEFVSDGQNQIKKNQTGTLYLVNPAFLHKKAGLLRNKAGLSSVKAKLSLVPPRVNQVSSKSPPIHLMLCND